MNSFSPDGSVSDLFNGTTASVNDDDIPVIERDESGNYNNNSNTINNNNNVNNSHSHDNSNNDSNSNHNSNNSNSFDFVLPANDTMNSDLVNTLNKYNKQNQNQLMDHGLSTYQPSPLIDDYHLIPQGTSLKFNPNLPPLPQLSESVLPPSLTIKALGGINASQPQKALNNMAAAAPAQTKKRKEPTGPKTRPAFVMKIWSMVNNPANEQYIKWSDDGKSFHVFHREEFMKLILPKYFKHNNFASFVRQLNMYGWHKVQDITTGSLYSQTTKEPNLNDGSVGGPDEVWQFENPYFIRGQEELLDKIQRNRSSPAENEPADLSVSNISLILNELDQIKLNQIAISEDLRRVRKDNKTLWQENYLTRERHQHQAQTLEKILSFLATVYGNSNGKILELENSPDFGGVLAPYRQQQQHQQQQQQQPPQSQSQNQQLHQPQGSSNEYSNQRKQNYQNPMSTQNQLQNPYFQDQWPPSSASLNLYDQGIPPPSPIHKPRLMLMNQAYKGSPDMGRNSAAGDTNSSIEDIMRSYENTPRNNSSSNMLNNIETSSATNNAVINKMNQQLNIQDQASSRNFFPELNGYSNKPSTPQPLTPGIIPHGDGDAMNQLEQNVTKQGQSIQSVLDWIQKIASKHQQQGVPNNNNNNYGNNSSKLQNNSNDNFELKPEFDEFDYNDYLNPSNSMPPTPNLAEMHPFTQVNSNGKRNIEEIEDEADDMPHAKK